MAEPADEKQSQRVTRRRFFQLAGTAACAVAGGGASALSVDYLRPRVLFEPRTDFVVEQAEALAPGQVLTEEAHQVYVLRSQEGFWSLSSVCTHLGCITRHQPGAKVIACPCHGSRFSLEGDVLAGPAPRPLRWLQMARSAKDEITVDTSIEVPYGTIFKL